MSSELDYEGRKARQIHEGAQSAFLELGFDGASVDEIARRAGVSKATLYRYYPDKRALFTAFVRRACEEQAAHIFGVGDDGDVEERLYTVARRAIELLLSPLALGIFRIAVAQAPRFPELGREFFEAVPGMAHRNLAAVLGTAVDRGELQIEDIDLAATQFAELCKAKVFYEVVFEVKAAPSDEEVDRVARAASGLFVRAHRPGVVPDG